MQLGPGKGRSSVNPEIQGLRGNKYITCNTIVTHTEKKLVTCLNAQTPA